MRRLWAFCDWSQYLHGEYRCGVRLRFDQGVDPEVRRACKQFVNWLREWYEFPVRVPIYFKNQKVVYSRSGKSFSAIFSGPYALNEEPYIRIAVGNYPNLLVARRQEDKLLKEHPAPLNMEVYENSQRKHQKSGSIMPKAQNKLLKICLAGDQNFLGYIL